MSQAEVIACWVLVETLREVEGNAVTILADNPDFNGQPNCAVECVGEWTGWDQKRFTGATIFEALVEATSAMKKALGK